MLILIQSIPAAIVALAFLVVWAMVRAAALADRCVATADEFTPSMERFGYVQDARNRGEI